VSASQFYCDLFCNPLVWKACLMPEIINVGKTRRNVLVSLAVNCVETLVLGVAALATGSVALRAQTTANCADVAVEVFLLIGVLSSARPADETHPLGYGRERFFWSLFAALGIFVGGSGLAFEDAIQSGLHPSPIDHFPIAYLVLALSVALDMFALGIALRPILKQAASRGISLRALRQRSTDPAAITVIVGGGCAVISAIVAALGLVVSQVTGSTIPDTVASALIGLLLLVASVLLLQTTRDLLSGRGVPLPMLSQMVQMIAAQEGVIGVPDLFAVVVGPSSLIVDGDVIFADELNVPAVEQSIIRSAAALRERWPSIEYVYLTPVSQSRPRRAVRSSPRNGGGK
jgi:cation diffusion facilitator family transporter